MKKREKPPVKSFIKQTLIPHVNYEIVTADPAVGIIYVVNNFISGHVRLLGRKGGAYPHKYLEMIESIFGKDDNTIEVCSGPIKGCFSVDINPRHTPCLIEDGQVMDHIPDNIFSRWRCDPPYNKETAQKMYNCEMPSIGKLLKAGARVLKPNSLMFLLCNQNYQHCPKGVKRIGLILITIIPNNEIRALNIYLKL